MQNLFYLQKRILSIEVKGIAEAITKSIEMGLF